MLSPHPKPCERSSSNRMLVCRHLQGSQSGSQNCQAKKAYHVKRDNCRDQVKSSIYSHQHFSGCNFQTCHGSNHSTAMTPSPLLPSHMDFHLQANSNQNNTSVPVVLGPCLLCSPFAGQEIVGTCSSIHCPPSWLRVKHTIQSFGL